MLLLLLDDLVNLLLLLILLLRPLLFLIDARNIRYLTAPSFFSRFWRFVWMIKNEM